MKKLIIALAAVAVATFANAAAMRWNSGNLYAPTATGSFSTDTISTLGSVQAVVWESASAITELSAGSLYEAYKSDATGSLFSGATVKTGSNSSNAYAANITGGSYAVGTPVYAAVLYVYTDANSNEYYIENYAANNAASAAKTTSNLASLVGGNGTTSTSQAIAGWTAAPEPTSGLLMLLGMAGLALRRKRA